MKTLLLTITLLFIGTLFSQNVTNINDTKLDVDIENISIKKLDSDSNSTSFLIWVKKGVKSHKHKTHSEVIYVIEGEGIMTVNGSNFILSSGDCFRIPKDTYHSLEVTTKKLMKVLSIQAPEFLGRDRIF